MHSSIAVVAAAWAGYAAAQSATATLFVDQSPDAADLEWAASVVSVASDRTVYALVCTSGPSSACGDGAPTVTITEGPSTYEAAYQTQTSMAGTVITAQVEESCVLSGTTAADCSGALSFSADGQDYSTSISTSVTDAASFYQQVPITAGADKTTASTASTGAAPAPTDARKVVGMGVAGALGVAGMLVL